MTVNSDSELRERVRGFTSYEDNEDELPQSQLDEVIKTTKDLVELETGSSSYYSDKGLGVVLLFYTCIEVKAAVENHEISAYQLGDESVELDNVPADESAQYDRWARNVKRGLNGSSAVQSGASMSNTSSYIGEQARASRHHK